MSAAEGVWDLLPDASTNLVQAYHLWTITVGETGTSARGAAEAECVLVLQQESSNRGVISFSVQEVKRMSSVSGSAPLGHWHGGGPQ